MCGRVNFSHLVLLHHAFYLVHDFASVVGHGEVWHLPELVPADVRVAAELLLQANLECLCLRGSIETTLLR